MFSARTSLPITTVLVLCVTAPVAGQLEPTALRALTHDAYDSWNRIGARALSNDGQWALFTITSEANDPVLTVVDLDGSTCHVVDRAEAPRFSADSRFVAFTVKPTKAALKEARQQKKPAAQLPADTLGILDLASGQITRVARTRSFRMPEKAGGWIAWQLGPEEEPDSVEADSTAAAPGAVQPRRTEPGRMPEPPPGAGRADTAEAADEGKREEGHPVVLRNLATGQERPLADVVTYAFTDNGARLVYTRANAAGDVDGIYAMETATGVESTLLAGKGDYRQVALDEAGRQVAFISNVDEFDREQPSWKLYHWDGRPGPARVVATPSS
ncbi:MAG: hypothetical protein ACRELT_15330, partial [Longimicrobiales bacterium]